MRFFLHEVYEVAEVRGEFAGEEKLTTAKVAMRKGIRTTSTNEEKEKKTKTRPRGKDAIWKLFLLLLACALCCAKTAQAEEAETQLEEPVKPPPGLGGIQRGQCRTEYADGVFNVRTCGKRGRELQINTHLVRTEANFEFWRDVQCREKLFVGNENGKIIEVGESLDTIFKRITTLETSSKAQSTTTASNLETLNAQLTKVSSLETSNTQLTTKVSSLETSNTQLTTKVSSLETTNTQLNTKVTDVIALVSALTTRVDNLTPPPSPPNPPPPNPPPPNPPPPNPPSPNPPPPNPPPPNPPPPNPPPPNPPPPNPPSPNPPPPNPPSPNPPPPNPPPPDPDYLYLGEGECRMANGQYPITFRVHDSGSVIWCKDLCLQYTWCLASQYEGGGCYLVTDTEAFIMTGGNTFTDDNDQWGATRTFDDKSYTTYCGGSGQAGACRSVFYEFSGGLLNSRSGYHCYVKKEEMPAGAILCPGFPTADYCDCDGDCNMSFCSCDAAKAPTCCNTADAQSTDGGQ